MRVLVTGGAGYIGSHACKALAAAGHTPIALDSLRTGHRWAVKWGPLEVGDISDTAALLRIFREHKPDAVMHFAALAYVGESVAKPDLYYATNVAGTLNLIDVARTFGVERFVFSSTCATYGEPETVPIAETTPQSPVNPYGRSKLMVEHILKDAAPALGLGSIALRYFNAAGGDPEGETGEEHDPETHLIPLALQAAAGLRDSLTIFGDDYPTPDGTCVRDYIHVADLAKAHVMALDKIVPGTFEAYNLGTGSGYSVREVIDTVKDVTGRDFPVKMGERRPGDPPELVADAAKVREAFGWTPTHSDLKSMIGTAWDWMAEHRTKVGLPKVV